MSRMIKDNTDTYIKALRVYIDVDSYLTALLLTDEVTQSLPDKIASPEELYTVLLQKADELGVRNPFPDKKAFSSFLKLRTDIGPFDWGSLLKACMDETRMLVLPMPLLELMMNGFDNSPKTVLVAEAEKFSPCLSSVLDEHPNTHFVLTTQSINYQKVLSRIVKDHENAELILADIYKYNFVDQRFDLILSNPIFGSRFLEEDSRFISKKREFIALENLSLHLNSGGLLEIVLPAGVAFSYGKGTDLRHFIQENYSLREISELPIGTFRNAGIRTYLIKVENTRPSEDEDIDVKRYVASGQKTRREDIKKLDVEDDTFVMLSELEEQDSWNVDRIFAKQDEDFIAFQNSKVRKELLGNVAEIFRGKSVRGKDPDGNIGVVNISNIGDYQIDYDGLEKMSLDERKAATYILKDGDVLIPARGTAIRTAVFTQQTYPCIASSNLIVIRPNRELLNSTYLKIFLDSPIGEKLLDSSQQGQFTMNISYKDLKALEIPLPPIDEQNDKAGEYMGELEQYKEAVQKAQKRWEGVLTKLQSF